MYLFSLILTSFVLSRVLGTLTPNGSVPIDCGGQQTFTCTVPGLAAWTVTGLMGITADNGPAIGVAAASTRVTTTDTGLSTTSTITITEFSINDNVGTVQCVDISGTPSVEGMANITVGVPSCPTTLLVNSRSRDFSSATITWDQPTNSPPVTSYDVTCNSSCTAMPCTSASSTCRVLSVSPCEDYSVTVLPVNSCGSSTGCTGNIVAVPSQGPPPCGTVGVVNDSNPCPTFTFAPPEGSVQPLTVMVSYHPQGDPSSAKSKNCSYPLTPQCTLDNLDIGIYAVTLTPQNNCGSPSTCSSITENITTPCNISVLRPTVASNLTTAIIIGVCGGIAGGALIGATAYGITIVTMRFTCYSYLGFFALLMCLCCPCCKGKARKSSSKQRIDSASPVTPPVQPPAQPPADEYADPQAIRDRKERGKEDKDKIQYAAIDFSVGAGSGAGEVKIHQKEEPVIYTTVQHV